MKNKQEKLGFTQRTANLKLGDGVVRFLNESKGAPEQRRVLDLLEGFQELDELVDSLRFTRYDANISFCDLDRQPRTRALRESLNEKLARYTFTPTVGVPFRLARERVYRLDVGLNVLTPTRHDESAVVKIIVEMADDGRIRLLKKCLQCGEWFRASKSDRIRCAICSRNDYRKTEAGKQANREQAAEHYQTQRTARLDEVRRVLSLWPSRPSTATKADWKGWAIGKAKLKLTRSFLTRAEGAREVHAPVSK